MPRARPKSTSPQLRVWAAEAGSPEKRYLATFAERRGYTPLTLAEKLDLDSGWLGRWFRLKGNGDGRRLQAVAKTLKASVSEIRAEVAPENLIEDDLKVYERDLIALVRSNREHFDNGAEYADKVRRVLRECRPETRRTVLVQYAQRRARQGAALEAAELRLAEDFRSSLESSADFSGSHARRNAWPLPEEPIAACIEAVETLVRLAGLMPFAKPPAHRRDIVLALFSYCETLRNFRTYRTREELFSAEGALKNMVEELRKRGGWPQDLLDEAQRECLELLIPTSEGPHK